METTSGREPFVVVELDQDQCRLIYGETPCAAVLGTTGVRKCYNTRLTCQDPDNYDAKPSVVDQAASQDISTTGAVEASFSAQTEETSPEAVFFKSDGTKLYVTGLNSDKVHQYALTTPWDVSTAGTVEASFDVSGEETSVTGLFFKSDGTKIYIIGTLFDRVRQYPLVTAWDISTAGAVEASFFVGGAQTSPQGIAFKADGTKLYTIGFSPDTVHQYPLSAAWDVSTAGSLEASFSVVSEDTAPTGLFVTADKLYMVGLATDTVYQYPLATPWNIGTAGAVEDSFSVASEDVSPTGIFFKPGKTKLYMIGSISDKVHQYPIPIPAARDATGTPQKIAATGAVEASFDVSGEDTQPQGIFFKPDGTLLYVVGSSSDKVHEYPLSTPWEVSTAGLVQASFDVSGEDGVPAGLHFKSDGTKLYIAGFNSAKIYQYPLSTAWDISTAGAVEASFDVSGEEAEPTGLFFKTDGTKLHIVGRFTDKVYQYPLSTAWDISTAGLVEASLSVAGEDTSPQGVGFNSDGRKLFVAGAINDKIYQYPLSTAWDIATAGTVESEFSVTTEETLGPNGLFFKDDDTKLYMTGTDSDAVHQYPRPPLEGAIDGALRVSSHLATFGQALSFDGIDDSVEVLDSGDLYGFPGQAPFTIEFFANPTSIPNSFARIITKEFTDGSGAQGWRIRLRQSDSTIVFERILNGASDSASAAISLGLTKFWAVVYDGTDMILYEEGVEKARTASSKAVTTNGAALFIGNESIGGIAEPYHGILDDVRIWSVARTESEIRERMILPLSGLETGIVSYFPFDTDPPAVATRVLAFTKAQTSAPRDLYLLPLLVNVDTAPTRLNPGGGSRDRGVLGDRAAVDVAFKDAPSSDRLLDKYRAERVSGAAQTDEGGYEPLDRGTFWGKWRARNQFFQNRRLRVFEGYVEQAIEDMQRREYFVDRLSGPNSDGRVVIRAKDVLKLADDKRAQAPTATPGELTATLTVSETTSFQATGALISDYPDEPGLVRIGDEVIGYATRTQVTADNVQFNTLSRGQRGSTADEHDAEDRVQRVIEFVNVLPWKIAENLLVNFGNIPASFVPITEWDAEGEIWLQQFSLSAVITEPTSVTQLLSEITEQAQFFIWWDEHSQTIKLKALRPPTEDPVALDDTSHLVDGGTTLTEDPEQRVSQVWVFFDQKDPTQNLDDEANFRRVRIRADLEAESAEQYGESRIKKVFSRWLQTEGQVLQVTKRTLDRFRDNPRTLKLRVDAKDRAAVRVGEVADVLTRTVLDGRGLPLATRWQIIGSREDPPGEAVALEMLAFEFTGRFGFYMETTAPTFANATEAEKRSGAWYARFDGKMPDNSEGYQYQ